MITYIKTTRYIIYMYMQYIIVAAFPGGWNAIANISTIQHDILLSILQLSVMRIHARTRYNCSYCVRGFTNIAIN